MNKKIPFTIWICFILLIAKGQDFRYTQYQYAPLIVNPALTASAYHLTFQANYRLQYRQPGPNYYTPAITFIAPFVKNESQRRWGGLGLSAISDKAGDAPQLINQGLSLSYAQNLYLGSGMNMSLGLQYGLYERRFDIQGLTSGSQYSNTIGFDPNASLNEPFLQSKVSYSDISAGVFLCKEDSNFNQVYYVGLSSRYLNRPDINFINYESRNTKDANLNPSVTLIAGIRIFNSDHWSITPDLQVNHFNNRNIINAGVGFHFKPEIDKESVFSNTRFSLIPRYVYRNSYGLGFEMRKQNFFVMVHYETYLAHATWRAGNQGVIETAVGFSYPLVKKKAPDPLPEYSLSDIKKYYPKNEVQEIGKRIEERQSAGNYEYVEDDDTTWYRTQKFSFELERRFKYGFNDTKLSDDGKQFANEILELLKKNPRVKLLVVGYTDNIGTEEVNLKISAARAKAFTDYLIKKGISPKRLRSEGKGESEPLNENRSKEERSLNRRVKFLLY